MISVATLSHYETKSLYKHIFNIISAYIDMYENMWQFINPLNIIYILFLHNVKNNNCIYIALHSIQPIDIEKGYLMQIISFCIL